LTTWSVRGPDLINLAGQLHKLPGVEQAVAFGSVLHVSGDAPAALEQAIAPFRTEQYKWSRVDSSLEDIFIHLMENAKGDRPS
jgi:ABC-2 type transport system ATP-binding protein